MRAARDRESLKNVAWREECVQVKGMVPPIQSPRVYKTGTYLLQNPVFRRGRGRAIGWHQPRSAGARSVPLCADGTQSSASSGGHQVVIDRVRGKNKQAKKKTVSWNFFQFHRGRGWHADTADYRAALIKTPADSFSHDQLIWTG